MPQPPEHDDDREDNGDGDGGEQGREKTGDNGDVAAQSNHGKRDGADEEDASSSSSSSSSSHTRYSSFPSENEEFFSGDVNDRYDTWKSRKRRESLSSFRAREEMHLGADELNERMQPDHLQRLRYVLRPDEAFGNIFKFDGVVTPDARRLELAAWHRVASENQLPPPEADDIVRMMHQQQMAPERAVQRVFYWTDDWGKTKRLAHRYGEAYRELLAQHRYAATHGLRRWLQTLNALSMPCCVCSDMDRASLRAALEQMEVHGCFDAVVSAEDEYHSLTQMLLTAALKLARPPQKCAVYDDTPEGITAAHDVSAKCVALAAAGSSAPGHAGGFGAYRVYELRSADLTVTSFDDLSALNVRRLFSEMGSEFMDTKTETER